MYLPSYFIDDEVRLKEIHVYIFYLLEMGKNQGAMKT
jgi:hypothetical protein